MAEEYIIDQEAENKEISRRYKGLLRVAKRSTAPADRKQHHQRDDELVGQAEKLEPAHQGFLLLCEFL